MAYTINKFNGEELIVLQDGTIDTSTSISLVGRNYVGYGESQNENFVFLLENFANDAPPSRPVAGQTWFDTSKNLMSVYDGTSWNVLGSTELSPTAPTAPADGNFWLKTPDNQLYVWNGSEWILIGPESVNGFGVTRARSRSLRDSVGVTHAVLILTVDGRDIAIVASEPFTIGTADAIPGFGQLSAGINLNALTAVRGNLTGNAQTADALSTPRRLNGVTFDGSADITIKSSTTNKLLSGDYILGNDFDGGVATTWSVDASSANVVGKVVARNGAGGFSAGTITADLVGDVTGNVTAASGTSRFDVVEANSFIGATLSGNSFTASKLQNPVNINGVPFDGSQNVTVPAAATTLTGNSINATVLYSSLIRLGQLESLRVLDEGVQVGSGNQLKISIDGSSNALLTAQASNKELHLAITDSARPTGAGVNLIPSSIALGLGGENAPALIPSSNGNINLGGPNREWNKIYANDLIGNAQTATTATSATNIAGGGAGSVPYQDGTGSTTFLATGTAGYVLTALAGNTVGWRPSSSESLVKGNYVTFTGGDGTNFNGLAQVVIAVDATSTNTASKVVARDSSGNFSAETVTANLVGNVTGNASGNAGSATRLQTPRTINGVSFDGTANITVADSTKIPSSGGSMTGFLTLHANPTAAFHAATKQYVDSFGLGEPIWAGATTAAAIRSTYSSAPVGTTVAFWEERVYTRGSGNGAAITVQDRYRRTIRKTSLPNNWSNVGT